MRAPQWIASIGAAYFAIIPANAATAIYVSERSDAMVAIFTLGALLAANRFLAGGRPRWLWGVNAFVLASMASKEIGVAVVLLLPLLALYWTVDARLAAASPPGGGAADAGLVRTLVEARRDGALRRQAFVLCVPPVAILVAYAIYRSLVLPTGLTGARYGTSNPVRGLASAVLWTFRAVPWEVSAPASLPLVLILVALALAAKPSPRAVALLFVGTSWVVLACSPLALLGQVEPRLLYLPEIGHAILVAGAVWAFAEAWSRGRTLSQTGQSARWRGVAVLGLLVTVALVTTAASNQRRAEDEFKPLGYKMLKGYRGVVDDPKRDLYPREHLENIERTLRYARDHDLDGAR